MRQIKFRAWDCVHMIQLKIIDLENPLPFTVMQYTGFKDKNGREIYEGDIVKDIINRELNVVVWLDFEGAWFIEGRMADGSKGFSLLSTFAKNVVLVGDIYQHAGVFTN